MQTVLITGGSRGIGRATALLCASAGANVAFSYRSDSAAAQTLVDCIEQTGGRALGVAGDVALERDIIDLFDQTERAFGVPDAVVVNAGIVAPASTLADMSLERMRRIFDVNVLGSYLTAREAARRLPRDRGGPGGSIVLVSSMASRLGAPGEYVDYAGAKGAVDALTIGLAKELGPQGVRVNAVRPGLIDTDIHASGGRPDRAQVLGATTPLGRAGTPQEVAEAIVWLLGDAASYVTGTFIDIAGGR